MLKQVYRFLSILIVSNLLIMPSALAKSPQRPDNCCCKKSFIQKLFCHKKPAEQKPDGQQQNNNNQNTNGQNPNIQPPTYDDGGYVTKYGVYFPDDIYNTYPPQQPNSKEQ